MPAQKPATCARKHQVQRFVMDRLFWPDPQFMSVAGPDEPWVVDLRGRAEGVLEAAIVPLRVSKTVYLDPHTAQNKHDLYAHKRHVHGVIRFRISRSTICGEADVASLVLPGGPLTPHPASVQQSFPHVKHCDRSLTQNLALTIVPSHETVSLTSFPQHESAVFSSSFPQQETVSSRIVFAGLSKAL